MQKYIAFDLYQRNERGAHEKTITTTESGAAVYLAGDVDARIEQLEKFLREFLLYFTSGNSIPVERATIRAEADIVRMAKDLMER